MSCKYAHPVCTLKKAAIFPFFHTMLCICRPCTAGASARARPRCLGAAIEAALILASDSAGGPSAGGGGGSSTDGPRAQGMSRAAGPVASARVLVITAGPTTQVWLWCTLKAEAQDVSCAAGPAASAHCCASPLGPTTQVRVKVRCMHIDLFPTGCSCRQRGDSY